MQLRGGLGVGALGYRGDFVGWVSKGPVVVDHLPKMAHPYRYR